MIVLLGILLGGCEYVSASHLPYGDPSTPWSSASDSSSTDSPATCAPVHTLVCGDRIAGDTSDFNDGSTDLFDHYPEIVGAYDGSEITYALNLPSNTLVEVRFVDPQPSILDLDLFLLSSESDSCSAESAVQRGFNELSFETQGERTYHLVVDGSSMNEGNFELEILCDGNEGDDAELDPVPELPSSIECDGDRVTGEAYDTLIDLTEISGNETIYTTLSRIDRIATTFETCGDTWGLFPTTYRHITQRIIQAIESREIEDTQWGHDIVVDFGSRYFLALNQALTGETPSYAWEHYYYLASNPNVSRTRTLLVAMVAHLTLDLPHALVAIDSTEDDADDYYVLGELMIEIVDNFLADLRTHYDTDAEDILHGFFFGDWIDGVYGEDTTITLNYQTIRVKAWNSRWLLQQPWGSWAANSEIYAAFWNIDGILATLDAAGTI